MTRRTGGHPLRWTALALAALLAAWTLAPAAVPVYDGLANPDEPYRYVDPPSTAATSKAPTPAKATVEVRDGVSGGQFANSREQGPQISVYVPPGALDVPSGVTSIQVTATPQAPRPPLPDDGTIVSNVYDISATADGQQVGVVGTGNQAPSVQMRAPTQKQPGPVFERRTAGGWERLRTIRVGLDVYQASQVSELGSYALVQLREPSAASDDDGGGISIGLLVGGVVVLALVGGIVAIRIRRTGAS